MNVLELSDLRNGYVDLVRWLVRRGESVTSRDMATRELTGVTLSFPDPSGTMLPVGVGRQVNTRLAAVESLQLLSGTGDGELLRRASPQYTDVLVRPDHMEYGAYGPRLLEQLEAVYVELRDHPESRRAVLTIWTVADLTHDGDRPCTLSLQFLLRGGRLELIVNLRSQDVWLGVPYDVFMFTQLQWSLARRLGVDVGPYVHHVGSLHVYDRNLEAAAELHHVPSNRPPVADYPTGVVARVDDTSFVDTAARLVNGEYHPHEDAVRENAWYVRQLVALGVVGTTV